MKYNNKTKIALYMVIFLITISFAYMFINKILYDDKIASVNTDRLDTENTKQEAWRKLQSTNTDEIIEGAVLLSEFTNDNILSTYLLLSLWTRDVNDELNDSIIESILSKPLFSEESEYRINTNLISNLFSEQYTWGIPYGTKLKFLDLVERLNTHVALENQLRSILKSDLQRNLIESNYKKFPFTPLIEFERPTYGLGISVGNSSIIVSFDHDLEVTSRQSDAIKYAMEKKGLFFDLLSTFSNEDNYQQFSDLNMHLRFDFREGEMLNIYHRDLLTGGFIPISYQRLNKIKTKRENVFQTISCLISLCRYKPNPDNKEIILYRSKGQYLMNEDNLVFYGRLFTMPLFAADDNFYFIKPIVSNKEYKKIIVTKNNIENIYEPLQE